jgi:hypothetical protein
MSIDTGLIEKLQTAFYVDTLTCCYTAFLPTMSRRVAELVACVRSSCKGYVIHVVVRNNEGRNM